MGAMKKKTFHNLAFNTSCVRPTYVNLPISHNFEFENSIEELK